MPAISVSRAPPTLPPINWPTTTFQSTRAPAPASGGIGASRIWPPPTPPRAPAMVFPAGPKLTFSMLAAAAFPPIAPADELDNQIDNGAGHVFIPRADARKSAGRVT